MATAADLDISSWFKYASTPFYRGSDPFNDAASSSMDELYTQAFDDNTTGTTYYVATDGSNGANGSEGAPFADLLFAASQMSGGDECIVEDGSYIDNKEMRINDNSDSIPNGISHTQRTIFRARNPGSVIIEFNAGTTSLNTVEHPFRLESSNYIWIDGFIVRMFEYEGSGPTTCYWVNSANNTITRCGARKNKNTEFGGGFSGTGDDLLFQDCWGCGATRYGFQGGGGLSSTQQNSIFRRCVWTMDFSATDNPQPHADITYYGSSSNTNGNHEHQNVLALDSKNHDEFTPSTARYGGIYNTHSPTDVVVRGSMVVNNQAWFSGIYLNENGAVDMKIVDCLVMNDGSGSTSPYAVSAQQNGTGQSTDQITVANFSGGTFFGNIDTPTNDLVLPDTPAGENPLLRDSGDGCEIIHCIGEFMSRYGDTGYNVPQTDLPLWPWYQEEIIRTECRIAMATPSGYTPAGNDSTRGYRATNMTISKYVIGYRGADYETELAVMYP